MSLWIQSLEYAVSQVAFSAGVPALNISPRDLVVQTMWIHSESHGTVSHGSEREVLAQSSKQRLIKGTEGVGGGSPWQGNAFY